MVELSLMASATFSPGIFHQEQGLCRVPKEFPAQLLGHGKRQEILRSGCVLINSPHLEDLWQSTSLLSDYNQSARAVPKIKKPVLINVQDAVSDSVLFSFGITQQCTRHEKILKYLLSGSNVAEGGGLDIPLLSDLMGLHTATIDMCPQTHVPTDDEFCLYDDGVDDSQHFIHPERQFFAPKPLLDFVGSHTSSITVHPDGRVLFTGSGAEMKDLLSIIAEFYPTNKWTNGSKQAMVVPYFAWSGGGRARANNTRGSSSKMLTQTIAPLKSVKLKPPPPPQQPKKKQNKSPGKERDLYSKNYFHVCESLLSVILDKKRGRTGILSLAKSGPEVTQLLTQFSAGIAGTGLAVLFTVVCKSGTGRVPFSAARLLNTGFGFGMFWLSWAVNRLRDTVGRISKSSSRPKLREEEIVGPVEKSVNEVLFTAAVVMAVAALRFV